MKFREQNRKLGLIILLAPIGLYVFTLVVWPVLSLLARAVNFENAKFMTIGNAIFGVLGLISFIAFPFCAVIGGFLILKEEKDSNKK